MRITVVHSFYSSRVPSGENQIVSDGITALREAGLNVSVVRRDTDQASRRPLYNVVAGTSVATGCFQSPLDAIEATEPDVVHVHNLFPNFGRSWINKLTPPLVATMHNFRTLCSAGTFYRDGHECFECLEVSWTRALRHACYRDSRIQTLPLAVSTSRRGKNPLLQRAEIVVALSDAAIDLFARSGVDRSKLRLGRNFLPTMHDQGPGPGGPAYLFVGRLDAQKGVERLVEQWPRHLPLRVVGEGPLLGRLKSIASPLVDVIGRRSRAATVELMRQSRAVLIPSLSLEGFPTVHIEALAAGSPVIAWEPTSSADFIKTHGGGRTMTWQQDLTAVMSVVDREMESLRTDARSLFDALFSQAAFTHAHKALYGEAVNNAVSRSPGQRRRPR